MTQLEFLKGMKKLSNYYLKDMKEEELATWYEVFRDKDVYIFYETIKSIGINNKYFPVCAELVEEYKLQTPIYLHKVLENNKSVPEDRRGYLKDMIEWFKYKDEYPKEILDEIFNYRKSLPSKNKLALGYEE